jgi:hypothetical protein
MMSYRPTPVLDEEMISETRDKISGQPHNQIQHFCPVIFPLLSAKVTGDPYLQIIMNIKKQAWRRIGDEAQCEQPDNGVHCISQDSVIYSLVCTVHVICMQP